MSVIQIWKRESKARAISLGTETRTVLGMAVKPGTGIRIKQVITEHYEYWEIRDDSYFTGTSDSKDK